MSRLAQALHRSTPVLEEALMGTEKTLAAVIVEKTSADNAATPGLGYSEEIISYSGDRIIRQTKVKLFRAEFADGLKIAVEVLKDQKIPRFQMATLRTPSDPVDYVDLQEQTGAAANKEIAELIKAVDVRKDYQWHLFHGEYPDPKRRLFHTRIELTQVSTVHSEYLRLCITYRPNTWSSKLFFPLESIAFSPHHP
jgi:hypothetical protein